MGAASLGGAVGASNPQRNPRYSAQRGDISATNGGVAGALKKVNKKTRNCGFLSVVLKDYASILAYLALASMNALRGGTSSPINIEKT